MKKQNFLRILWALFNGIQSFAHLREDWAYNQASRKPSVSRSALPEEWIPVCVFQGSTNRCGGRSEFGAPPEGANEFGFQGAESSSVLRFEGEIAAERFFAPLEAKVDGSGFLGVKIPAPTVSDRKAVHFCLQCCDWDQGYGMIAYPEESIGDVKFRIHLPGWSILIDHGEISISLDAENIVTRDHKVIPSMERFLWSLGNELTAEEMAVMQEKFFATLPNGDPRPFETHLRSLGI